MVERGRERDRVKLFRRNSFSVRQGRLMLTKENKIGQSMSFIFLSFILHVPFFFFEAFLSPFILLSLCSLFN